MLSQHGKANYKDMIKGKVLVFVYTTHFFRIKYISWNAIFRICCLILFFKINIQMNIYFYPNVMTHVKEIIKFLHPHMETMGLLI